MHTDAAMCGLQVGIIAVVQDHQLDVAEQGLYKTNRMLRKQEVIQNDSCG
jgi:hypothetical protein